MMLFVTEEIKVYCTAHGPNTNSCFSTS